MGLDFWGCGYDFKVELVKFVMCFFFFFSSMVLFGCRWEKLDSRVFLGV